MSVPYLGILDGSTATGKTLTATNQTVNNTTTVSATSGAIRITWSSGTTANTFSGYARLLDAFVTALDVADGEICCDVLAPNGSGVGPVVVARFTASGNYNGYVLKEVTPGDPTSWQLYSYTDNSPEKGDAVGAAITPAGGVTDYTDLHIRYGFVGQNHYIKIWKGTEPGGFQYRTDATKTTGGDPGVGAWGANGSGEYAAFDNIKVCKWGVLKIPHTSAGMAAADTASATSYTFTDLFDAPKDTPLWIGISNSKGSVPETPTISATNLVVDSTVATELIGGADKRLTVFKCHASADIVDGDLTVDFGAGTQTSCLVNVNVCGGASTFAGSDTAADTGSGATSIASGLSPSFSNPYATSGVIFSMTKLNTNGVTMDGALAACGHTTDGTPAQSLTTGWDDANDTDINPSWTGSVRRCAIAAEVQLDDPSGEYPVYVYPACAAGTGTAHAPSVSIKPGTPVATGTGTAHAPTPSIKPGTPAAEGTGTAYQPTITTSGADATNVTPSAATGTGTAYGPSVAIAPSAPAATGTGTAAAPTPSVGPSAPTATGTGTAPAPTVSLSPGTSTPDATGAAGGPTSSVSPNVPAAAGTGAALAPSGNVTPTIPVAEGTGTAIAPSIWIKASAGIALGVGTAYGPTIDAGVTITDTVWAVSRSSRPAYSVSRRDPYSQGHRPAYSSSEHT